MTHIPCPHCGELLECAERSIGRKIRCPRCRVMLRLDADSDGRPQVGRPGRRLRLLWLPVVATAFAAGLGIGYVGGQASASRAAPAGVTATSVGFFSASNNVVIDSSPPAPGPTPPANR